MSKEAPFPYPGGKSRVTDTVWERLGQPGHYIEPFCGSAAMLLSRPGGSPGKDGDELINDLNGFLSNTWRSIKLSPSKTAEMLEWPINEIDQEARKQYVHDHKDDLEEKLKDDPEYHDPKIAAWWIWGQSMSIGTSWNDPDSQSMPCISSRGRGVHALSRREKIDEIVESLSSRLRYVGVMNGGWKRILTSTVVVENGKPTPYGIFIDPPYPDSFSTDFYQTGSESEVDALWSDLLDWCLEHQDDPDYRIALSGITGHGIEEVLSGWDRVDWKRTQSGWNKGVDEEEKNDEECIWFSPHCIDPQENIINQFT